MLLKQMAYAFGTSSMVARRYAQSARHPEAQEELAANLANTLEAGN
jgi:hypothetical protein